MGKFASTDIYGELVVSGGIKTGVIDLKEDISNLMFVNQDVTSDLSAGTEVSYHLGIDDTPMLEVYAESDGSGGIQNEKIYSMKDILPIDDVARDLGSSSNRWDNVYTGDLIYKNDFKVTEKENSIVWVNAEDEPLMELTKDGNLRVTGNIEMNVDITI